MQFKQGELLNCKFICQKIFLFTMRPFNYFKKKREKAEREHLCQKEEAPLHKLNQESIACERADQAEENHSKTLRIERVE